MDSLVKQAEPFDHVRPVEQFGWIAGAWARGGVPGRQRFAALGADHLGVGVVAARLVPVHDRLALVTGQPAVAPPGHRGEHTEEVAALLGEQVVVADRVALVFAFLQQALVDQGAQPVGERVARDAQ